MPRPKAHVPALERLRALVRCTCGSLDHVHKRDCAKAILFRAERERAACDELAAALEEALVLVVEPQSGASVAWMGTWQARARTALAHYRGGSE